MIDLGELLTLYGIETLVRLTNDDPNAPIDPSSINYDLLNELKEKYETIYGKVLEQKPALRFIVYRLIILELHKRREDSGKQTMDLELKKEYLELKNELDNQKFIVVSFYEGGKYAP
ncbi:MAG: hypothetical protein ABIM44_07990 [candidate division WOR-3 bacterium]